MTGPEWTDEEKAFRTDDWLDALSPEAREKFNEIMGLKPQPCWKRLYLRIFRRYTR